MKKRTHLFIFFALLSLFGLPAYAAVSGKVMFEGDVPPNELIDMSSDPTCLYSHENQVDTEAVLVNEDGSLRNVFVYVKSGLEGRSFDAPAEPAELDQRGCQYVPHVQGVMVNQEIEMKSSDKTLHNIHSRPKNSKGFNLGMPKKDVKVKRKFSEPEVMVKFKCDVHPWMTAYIGVMEHPYFSTTGDGGTFEIKDLPDGTYTLEAWHEVFGTQTAEITVANGEATADFTFSV